MEHTRMRSLVLMLAAVALLLASVVVAQPELPKENHYSVYYTDQLAISEPLKLTDQFGTHESGPGLIMEKWSNPATKIHLDTGHQFPPIDPTIHQTWWHLYPPPETTREIVGIDQFGVRKWRLGTPDYLLVPALKNVPEGEPPIWNHYLCYQNQLDENFLLRVLIIDQFGNWQVNALYPRWFCNPVEKEHLDDGRIYPIVDKRAHLACYLFYNLNPMGQTINAVDQFGNWQMFVNYEHCLCVPALKEHVVSTEESTWGRIKALYN